MLEEKGIDTILREDINYEFSAITHNQWEKTANKE